MPTVSAARPIIIGVLMFVSAASEKPADSAGGLAASSSPVGSTRTGGDAGFGPGTDGGALSASAILFALAMNPTRRVDT